MDYCVKRDAGIVETGVLQRMETEFALFRKGAPWDNVNYGVGIIGQEFCTTGTGRCLNTWKG